MPLVLSRKEQQSVIMSTDSGERITVTVKSLSNGQARLSFDAPESVDIWREEIFKRLDNSERRG